MLGSVQHKFSLLSIIKISNRTSSTTQKHTPAEISSNCLRIPAGCTATLSRSSQPSKKRHVTLSLLLKRLEHYIQREPNSPLFPAECLFPNSGRSTAEHAAQTTVELSNVHPGCKPAAPGQPDLHTASHGSKVQALHEIQQ